jgi:hypothetical protein
MASHEEVIESTGETQLELLRGLCDRATRNYKRKDFQEAIELIKLAGLVHSSLQNLTQHLSDNSSVED